MMDEYLNLRLKQFLDIITDTKLVYQLTLGEQESIEGTLPELRELFSSLEDNEQKESLLEELKDKKEYEFDYELSLSEIYNYLEKVTSNFDKTKTEIVLFDVEVYYSMEFLERIQMESEAIFKKNNWEVPVYKGFNPILKKEDEVPAYKEMLKRTHPFDGFNINTVISLLKNKLKIKDKEIPHHWNHPIFKTPESLKLFSEFMEDGNKNKYLADCSFIYRMMHDREKPTLIHEHIKPGDFKTWLNETFPDNEPLTAGLKTWNNLGTDYREKRYNQLKTIVFHKQS